MAGLGKKPCLMAAPVFAQSFDAMSKAALIDALWCACQLGTDETTEQIEAMAARNALIALQHRGDPVPKTIAAMAERRIDSDAD